MDRREMLALSGALAAATLAGCTGGGGSPTETETDETPSTDTPTEMPTETPDGEPPTGEPTVDDQQLAALAAGNAEFALDLHSHLAVEKGGNQFLSPYSISVALAMTYAGARGETRKQMEETLRYTLGDEIHPAFSDLQAALESRATAKSYDGEEVDAFQLAIANALWGREGYPFSDEYLTVLEENYGAGLREADFVNDPDGERKRINQWVAEQTEDRIKDLLPADAITPQTVLVLTNAIYFMAGWMHKFDPENTEDGTFTALDGSESTVPLMQQELEANYADLPNAQAVELPYSGEEVSMVLILPDEGEFESFERDLDSSRLFGIFQELSQAQGTIVLPRFEFETEVQLSDALSALGMPSAFRAGADFSGMVEGDQGDLAIDEVYHKTFVSVDEEGTEAAAATAAVVTETSLPPQWDELRFDRPFLFCIRDKPTDAVLFYGRVVDAGAAQGEN